MMNKLKISVFISIICFSKCFAQFEPEPSGLQKLLSKNKEENQLFMFANTRFGARTLKTIHQKAIFQYNKPTGQLIVQEVERPQSNLINHIDFSICQYVSRTNFVFDFFNFGISFRGNKNTPGTFRSSFLSTGFGYQVRFAKQFWLRSLVQIGYSEFEHVLGEKLVFYEDEEEEEKFRVSARQTKLLLRPELSLVKNIGKDHGISLSLNASYDGGAFKSDRLRFSGVGDEAFYGGFQNYNMRNENGHPLNTLIVNPNQFIFTLGICFFVDSSFTDD